MDIFFILVVSLYGLMMLGLAYGLLRNFRAGMSLPSVSGKDLPCVSVVVAARNEAGRLRRLLDALSGQTAEHSSFEVIIVDDYSTDQTAAIVNSYRSTYPLTLLSLKDHALGTGKKAALKAGISAAQNEIILMTDADCKVDKDWILCYQKMFCERSTTMVAGIVILEEVSGIGSRMEALDLYGLIAASAGASGLNLPFMCNGANMAFQKTSFLAVNGYADHEHLSSGDDVFLLHRFRKMFGSHTIRWNLYPGGWVKIQPNPNLSGFISQRLRWASKSQSYNNSTALLVAFLVLLGNATVMISFLLSLFSGEYRLFIALFLIKFLSELPLMLPFIRYIGQESLWLWLLPSALLYPFYTTILGVTSLVWKPRWKGRKIR